MLLGAGIITFFAANWGEMSKLSKLIVLFGSMWTAYVAAYYFIEEKKYLHLGQAMLLLRVIVLRHKRLMFKDYLSTDNTDGHRYDCTS